MDRFFPIDNPEDLPFEKSKKFTKQPLGLSHGRMNERDVGTAHGANATLMQGSKRRRIARAGAANCIQKEVVIAPLYEMGVVTLRRNWPCGSVLQTGLPLGQGDRGSEAPGC